MIDVVRQIGIGCAGLRTTQSSGESLERFGKSVATVHYFSLKLAPTLPRLDAVTPRR